MKKISINTESAFMFFIGFVFIVWSVVFIYNSSFITIDGNRSYSLFDDAMISMRYAWKFSHGYGLVWNPGEYVQGYSNLLMTLLMSISTLLFSKTNAVLSIQISGIFFMLAVAYFNMRIAGHIFQFADYRRAFIKVLSFLFGLSYYPLAYWSLMGMETGLFSVLLLLSVLFALRFTQSRNIKFLALTSVSLGFAFLTRNESIIPAFFIWLYVVWKTIQQEKDYRYFRFLLPVGLYSLFVFGQLSFQYFYYGEALPNTYILKLTGMSLLLRIRYGVVFIEPFFRETGIVLIASVLSVLAFVNFFRSEKMLIFSLVWSMIFYQIYIGGDAWDYWRITSPIMPLAMILYVEIIMSIINRLFFRLSAVANLLFDINYVEVFAKLVMLFLLLGGVFVVNFRFLPEILLKSKPYQTDSNKVNVNTAAVLNDILADNATIGVIWAGAIPYYIDNRVVDFLGKSDRYIANLPPRVSGYWSRPGHNKYDLNYSIIHLRPTYIQRTRWDEDDLSGWVAMHYVKAEYFGMDFYFLKNSPDVLWDKVKLP